MAEKRNTYKIQELDGSGEVYIADEVVAIRAGGNGGRRGRVHGREHHQRAGGKTGNEESV